MKKTKPTLHLRHHHNFSSIFPTLQSNNQQSCKNHNESDQKQEKPNNNIKCFIPSKKFVSKYKSNQSMTNQEKINAARRFLLDLKKSKDLHHYLCIDKDQQKKEKRYRTLQGEDEDCRGRDWHSVLQRKMMVRDRDQNRRRLINLMDSSKDYSQRTKNQIDPKQNEEKQENNEQIKKDEQRLDQKVKRWVDRRNIGFLKPQQVHKANNDLEIQQKRLEKGQQLTRSYEVKILQMNNALRCRSLQKPKSNPEQEARNRQKEDVILHNKNKKEYLEQFKRKLTLKTQQQIQEEKLYGFTYNLLKNSNNHRNKKKHLPRQFKLNEISESILHYDHYEKQEQVKNSAQGCVAANYDREDKKINRGKDETLAFIMKKYGRKTKPHNSDLLIASSHNSGQSKQVEYNGDVSEWGFQCTDCQFYG